ncbi:CehA/McbA family metallohydrolase [Myxococcota bacterium]
MKTHRPLMDPRVLSKLAGCSALIVLSGCAPSSDTETLGVTSGALRSGTGYQVYYGTLHNHSEVSDGRGSPSAAYQYARDTAGLDFFSLADHAYMITTPEWETIKSTADRYDQDQVFAAFWGFEWSSSSQGHVTVVNTSDYTTSTDSATDTFEKLDRWLSAREGVAFLNHPKVRDWGKAEFTHFSHQASDQVVGIELFNRTSGFDTFYHNDGYFDDDGGLGCFDEGNQRGWKLGAAGGDDNHRGTWGTATDYRLGVLADSLTRSDLFDALQARRFFATLDRNLALSFQLDEHEMGSAVPAGTYSATIAASDGDGELFERIELKRGGSVVATWSPPASNPSVSFSLTAEEGEYYYVMVQQDDGDAAISSPIWVEEGSPHGQPPSAALTGPSHGDSFTVGDTVQLQAEASDAEGTVERVEFYANETLLGQDLTTPYEYSWVVTEPGEYSLLARAVDNDGSVTASSPVDITVAGGSSFRTATARISSGADDAEESARGLVSLNSSDLELTQAGGRSGVQTIGLRFVDLNLPPGATITRADVQFTVDEVSSGSTALTVWGEAADSSAPFTSTTGNLSNRQRTASSETWVPQDWSTVGAAGSAQRTPNLSSILQEIVTRPNYAAASAITLVITGTGKRVAEAYDGDAAAAPLLAVEYTP